MNQIKDQFNNLIYRKNNGIYLQLVNDIRTRKLGTIKDDRILMRRNESRHLFRKTNSYGFNYVLLDSLNKVKTVDLRIDGKKYLIPIDYILKNGEFLNFKQQGFELQIFLKVELINNFKT